MLEKMFDFAYGALIFLILVGIAFAVYQVFWAKAPTTAEQNLDSVFSELKEVKQNSCFDVVIRPAAGDYSFVLYAGGNSEPACSGQPCLCLLQRDTPVKCNVVPNEKNDCKKGLCVVAQSILPIVTKSVRICNADNALSITYAV